VNKTRKTWWLGAAVLALLGVAGKAQALGVISSTATLSIDVTMTGSLSVNINSANTSSQTVVFLGANSAMVSPSTVAVQNNSGVLSERWKINSANGFDSTSPGTDPWTLVTTTAAVGADSFAIQAVFGSSNTVAAGCPAGAAADWNPPTAAGWTAPALLAGVASATQYTTTVFADVNLNTNGSPQPDMTSGVFINYMNAGGTRVLCWRIIGPSSVVTTDSQIIPIMVTAY
jgi:hypothetical protein